MKKEYIADMREENGMTDLISRAAIIRAVEENPFVTDSVKSFVRCSALACFYRKTEDRGGIDK